METAADDFMFLPLGEAVTPTKGLYFQRYHNMWWAVHSTKGLVFFNPKNRRNGRRKYSYWGSPQCNADARIKQMTAETIPFPVEVRQVPLVFVQVDINGLARP
jgi:hypothetical protein